MSRAISEILYVANSSQAVKATNDYANAQDKLSSKTNKFAASANTGRIAQMNFSRVVQDAPFGFVAIQNNIDPLVQSFQQLRAETGSNASAMKAFLSSFAGPAGALAVINLAVSAYTAYTLWSQKANKKTKELKKSTAELGQEVKNLQGAFNSLVKIDNPFGGGVSISTSDLPKAIEASSRLVEDMSKAFSIASQNDVISPIREQYKKLRAELSKNPNDIKTVATMSQLATEENKAIRDASKAQTEKLASMAAQVNAQSVINDQLKEELARYEAQKTLLQEIQRLRVQDRVARAGEMKDAFGFLSLTPASVTEAQAKIKEKNKALMGGTYTPQGVQFQSGLIPEQKQAKEMFQAYLQEGTKFRTTFATAFQQTLTQYGSLAFDRMFGHANNLLSIFAKSLFSQVIGGFSSYLTGGFFSAIGLPVPGVGGRPISINIDGTVVAEYVDGRVRQKQERFERRSI